jgi:hypothetical protein
MEISGLLSSVTHSGLLSCVTQWGKIAFPAIAGLWVFYKYYREGFHRPRIEFDIECNVVGSNESDSIVEFVVIANNKGKIRFTFHELQLRVRGINEGESFAYWRDSKRMEFPEKVLDENIIPSKYKYYFVEPGINQAISYITKIPKNMRFVVAFAAFKRLV